MAMQKSKKKQQPMTPEGPKLKTKAGKLVHQMRLTSVDTFEKERAEFDRNEQVL